jgi:hypothetical protein
LNGYYIFKKLQIYANPGNLCSHQLEAKRVEGNQEPVGADQQQTVRLVQPSTIANQPGAGLVTDSHLGDQVI